MKNVISIEHVFVDQSTRNSTVVDFEQGIIIPEEHRHALKLKTMQRPVRCPKCKFLVRRSESSNDNLISCPNCEQNFCWLCLDKSDARHFSEYNLWGCPSKRYVNYDQSNLAYLTLERLLLSLFMLFVALCLWLKLSITWMNLKLDKLGWFNWIVIPILFPALIIITLICTLLLFPSCMLIQLYRACQLCSRFRGKPPKNYAQFDLITSSE